MLDSIRLRLALWHLLILAALQVGLCFGVYLFLFDHLLRQADRVLQTVMYAVASDVQKTLAADPHTPFNQASAERVLHAVVRIETAVLLLDRSGNLLAERPLHAAQLTPLASSLPATGQPRFYTDPGVPGGEPGARRIGVGAFTDPVSRQTFVVAVSQSLESRLSELHTARLAFLITVPVLLALTGLGGWLLTGRSLAPATAMSERARHIDAEDLNERISVANPRDELGQLASSFNQLLDRVAAATTRERKFMADAAHQLRTPISVIQTASAVTLSSPHRTSDEYRSALQTIEVYARRLGRNVEDVFRLARADAGFKSIQSTGLYLEDVLQQAVRAARLLAAQENIEIRVLEACAAPYRGDEALLGEMVLNLLENAVKYTAPGGSIGVALTASPTLYTLSVSDTGRGISPSHQARIFDRFYRAPAPDGDLSPRVEGSGLGLTIALWIARAHGGSLKLQNSSCAGSTFVASLPRTRSASPASLEDR